MSFYEIWTAGVMLAGICARFNKPGKYPHLGACSNLSYISRIPIILIFSSSPIGRNGRLWVFLDDGRSAGLEQWSNNSVNEIEAMDATS